MKKEGTVVLLLAVLLVSFVSFAIAQDDDERVDRAYDCLEDKVEDRCDDLSVEEQAFTVLAIGDCESELEDNGKDGECWPSSGCRLRDTALAILALDRVGGSTDDAEDWLLDQIDTPQDLIWYLEIDTDEESVCKVSYDDRERDIIVREDKKLSGSGGPCLSLAQDDYWLKVDGDCYGTNFTISCDKSFITTLLYKKRTGSTVYVSSETNSASSEGKTEETVNALCFGKDCDYEGSLWSVLALSEEGHDLSPFLPYLIAMAEDNERYFPSTFLYMTTDYDDYFTQIIDQQKDDYWKIPDSPYHQFYDTALALLALQGLNAEQASSAKDYLLEVQGSDGCWRNDVRDTAFILYAAWPRPVSGAGAGDMDFCEDYDYYCISPLDCDTEDLIDLPCAYGAGKVCCKTQPLEETCSDKGGIECSYDEDCDGSIVPASDTTNCCVGICEEIVVEDPECVQEGFDCRYSCDEDEEERIYDCDSGEVCCAPKPAPVRGYWWIWILVILIILVILGIVFKNRLRTSIFKIKSRGRGPSRAASRPGPRPGPPGRPPARMMPRRMPMRRRTVGRPPVRSKSSKSDKELDETLKKLREMSK